MAHAQAVIRGRVTAPTGQAVPAGSVVLSELGIGSSLDANGACCNLREALAPKKSSELRPWKGLFPIDMRVPFVLAL